MVQHIERSCAKGFHSQWARVVNRPSPAGGPEEHVHISDYLKDFELQESVKNGVTSLRCVNDHPLIKYESEIRRSHFKHKNMCSCTNRMSEWHIEWQSHFKLTEIELPAQPGISYKQRFADVLIEGTDIQLEFQHSFLKKIDITQRSFDYNVHGNCVYWVVDCNDECEVMEISNGVQFSLKFANPYKIAQYNLEKYDVCGGAAPLLNVNVIVNVGDEMFLIDPSRIRCGCISTLPMHARMKKHDFISELISSGKIFQSFDISQWSSVPQCTMVMNQRGAGNGKTYESVQLMSDNSPIPSFDVTLLPDYNSKTCFIYLTKVHSAKEVIVNELKDQISDGRLPGVEIIGGIDNIKEQSKKYEISVLVEGEKKKIVIATIDSFTYAIHNPHTVDSNGNYFKDIVRSIADSENPIRVNPDSGFLKFGSTGGVNINKDTLIIIDEAQDLSVDYIQSVARLMTSTHVDSYIIGDLLQSIWDEHNVYSYLWGLDEDPWFGVKLIKNKDINHCRRFHDSRLAMFVNTLVPFVKYELPEITKCCELDECKYTKCHTNEMCSGQCPYELFTLSNDDDDDDDENIRSVSEIMEFVKHEVYDNNYLPNNFTFIFPVLKGNKFAQDLEEQLQDFWVNKFQDKTYISEVLEKHSYWKDKYNNGNYYEMAVLHTAQTGSAINLKLSENSSRILSIHSSKGLGCEVVFVLGVNENSLKKFSKETGNLKYDSLLHVSITRSKCKLYFEVCKNGDDIYQRISKLGVHVKDQTIPDIRHLCRGCNLAEFGLYLNECRYKDVDSSIISKHATNCFDQIPKCKNRSHIIEEVHHHIRTLLIHYLWVQNLEHHYETIQFWLKLKDLTLHKPQLKCGKKLYNTSIKKLKAYRHDKMRGNQGNHPTIPEFPILKFSDNMTNMYHKIPEMIRCVIDKIQAKIRYSARETLKIPKLCPIEIVVLYHMLSVTGISKERELNVSMMNVYGIFQYYYNSIDKVDFSEHLSMGCKCNDLFVKGRVQTPDGVTSPAEKYKIYSCVTSHYETTSKMRKICESFIEHLSEHYPNEKFKIHTFKNITFDGCTRSLNTYENLPIVASSDKTVINVMISPQFNRLNICEKLAQSVVQTFVIKNPITPAEGEPTWITNNFNQFSGRPVHTCIVTLDSESPIWYDFNDQPDNDALMRSYLFDFITSSDDGPYGRYHKLLYDFWVFVKLEHTNIKKHAASKDPKKGLTSLQHAAERLSEFINALHHKSTPHYIAYVFLNLDRDIQCTKKQSCEISKENIKEKINAVMRVVNDRDLFVEYLNHELNECAERYIGLNQPESDDDLDY